MATYTYKKCPHCGKTYESYSTHTQNFNNHSGSPFRICPRCGKTFIDKDFKEPALKPYVEESYSLGRCLLSFLFPFGIGGIIFLLLAILSDEYKVAMAIISVFAFVIYIWLAVYISKNKKKNQQRDREEYEESVKRLSNPEYAQALKDAGFFVPSKYLSNRN